MYNILDSLKIIICSGSYICVCIPSGAKIADVTTELFSSIFPTKVCVMNFDYFSASSPNYFSIPYKLILSTLQPSLYVIYSISYLEIFVKNFLPLQFEMYAHKNYV